MNIKFEMTQSKERFLYKHLHHLNVLRPKGVPFLSFKYMMKAGRDFTS